MSDFSYETSGLCPRHGRFSYDDSPDGCPWCPPEPRWLCETCGEDLEEPRTCAWCAAWLCPECTVMVDGDRVCQECAYPGKT
jgi:hypothetical protein